MAIVRTQKANVDVTSSTTSSWTSDSFDVNENDLLVVVVTWQKVGSSYSEPEWSVSSSGMTFTRPIGIGNGDTWAPPIIEVYYDFVPSSGSRTVTVNAGSKSHNGSVHVFSYSGVNTVDPVRQTKETTTTTTNGAYSYDLDAAPLETSEILAILVSDGYDIYGVAPGTGWTEIYDGYYSGEAPSYGAEQLQYRTGSTSTSISYDDVNVNNASPYGDVVIAALEIRAEGGPPLSISSSSVALDSRSGSITVTAPSGIQDGDILIGGLLLFGSGSQIAGATPPSGFSLITTSSIDNPISVVKLGTEYYDYYLYWKRASSESGDYTFTFTGTSNYCQAYVGCYRGALSTGSPFDVASDNDGTGTTTTFTGVTTTADNTLLIGASFDWGDSSNNLSPPTDFFERIDITEIYLCDKPKESAGSTGNFTMTNNSTGGNPWGAFLLALLPSGYEVPNRRTFTVCYV